MNSEKVKEIKKVLEMFAIDDKEMTLLQSPVPQGESCEITIKYADILTLINELGSENERLRSERDVLVSKKIAERPKTKASVVAPIYVLPNVETPEMMLKLGEKNLLQQFAERLKSMPFNIEFNFKKSSYEDVKKLANLMKEYFVIYIDETLKEFEL